MLRHRVDCEALILNKRKDHRKKVSETTLKTKYAVALKMNSEVKGEREGLIVTRQPSHGVPASVKTEMKAPATLLYRRLVSVKGKFESCFFSRTTRHSIT